MRKIEKKMVEFIDGRLSANGLAQHAIETKNARALFIEAAKVCVGIREKTNRNDGPMVELMQETVGGAGREAWCMSFIQTCIAYAEEKTGVKSPIHSSEHCMTVWAETPKEQRVKRFPLPGAIIIWNYWPTQNGHTGCLLGTDGEVMQAVEGNTTAGKVGDEVVREGGGVYFTERGFFGSGRMKRVGFLKPF